MNEPKKAAFNFEKYRIEEFSFKGLKSNEDSLGINFEPSGTFNEKKSVFTLRFTFTAHEGEDVKNANISATLVANFKFNEQIKFDEIPVYFYRNAIALVFPYLRSFISSMTLQANIKLIVLPVMNLSSLEQTFKDNSSISE